MLRAVKAPARRRPRRRLAAAAAAAAGLGLAAYLQLALRLHGRYAAAFRPAAPAAARPAPREAHIFAGEDAGDEPEEGEGKGEGEADGGGADPAGPAAPASGRARGGPAGPSGRKGSEGGGGRRRKPHRGRGEGAGGGDDVAHCRCEDGVALACGTSDRDRAVAAVCAVQPRISKERAKLRAKLNGMYPRATEYGGRRMAEPDILNRNQTEYEILRAKEQWDKEYGLVEERWELRAALGVMHTGLRDFMAADEQSKYQAFYTQDNADRLRSYDKLPADLKQSLPSMSPSQFAHQTCAVVGNSGTLTFSGLGRHIDSHEIVLRLNQGPTHTKDVSYVTDVGNRTDYRLLNKKWTQVSAPSARAGAED